MKRAIAIVGVISSVSLLGCAKEQVALLPSTPATQPATDEQLVDPNYWLAQPSAGSVSAADFEKLWATAEKISRDYLFAIDRRDRRDGLLTTQPTISAQWFEPWRKELQTSADIADSSLATHRRTIYFSFDKTDGQYVVTPKVLVERQSLSERRVSGVLGKNYLRRDAAIERISGTREIDAGVLLPTSYWYPVGRDYAFEQKLVEDLNASLK